MVGRNVCVCVCEGMERGYGLLVMKRIQHSGVLCCL